ncbi:STE3-domain-containing protein [Rickenella mellea]|uniref:STE3-domain-containing protein n=1 Tax=Rickenella mellea TaxID=50990 RepID=A0A4Y7PVZ8_9AGAM|nr:STE3-domain-containing protein [Rickenella mellea]
MEPTYPLYPIISFICFILLLVPLPLHWQLRNAGTSMYIIWTATSGFIMFANSIIWHNNAIDKAPVWCDIAGRVILGNSIAIPACDLCIQRRLYLATRIEIANQKEKMKYFIQDLLVSLGLPLLVLALAYIVQGNRYDIFEELGCYIPIYNVWPAYPIFYMWPLATSSVSLCYSVLTLRAFASRRTELNEFVNSGTLNFKRHVRLMCLASTEIAFTIPLSAWSLQDSIRTINPYISWEHTHFGFSITRTFPDIIWRSDESLRLLIETSRWGIILCAIVFIAFFTFTGESCRTYSPMFGAVLKCLGWSHLNKLKYPTRIRGHDTLPPMFPTDRTGDGTFMSTNPADVVHEMAGRERMATSGHFFDHLSTMVFPDFPAQPHIATNSMMNIANMYPSITC